jgi:hypothetical protein
MPGRGRPADRRLARRPRLARVALTCRVPERTEETLRAVPSGLHDGAETSYKKWDGALARAMSGEVLGRVAGLVVLAVLTALVLANGIAMPSGVTLNFLHLINLVFHEAGHVIFGFFGRFIAILGGSLNQVLVPAVCTGVFLARRQLGSAAVTLFWTGESLADVAVYVYDGRAMALPLLAEGLIHDWNFILGSLGLLYRAETLGRLTFALGALTMTSSLVMLGWDAWTRMLSSERRSSE